MDAFLQAIKLLAPALVCGALVTVGCGEGRSDTSDAGPDSTSDSSRAASICGWLTDTEGIQVVGVGAIACNEQECHSSTSSSTGTFCIHVTVAADYLFRVSESRIAGKHYGDVFFPLKITAADVAGDRTINLKQVVLPRISGAVALNVAKGGTLDLGGGVSLQVPPDSAVLPPLASKAEVGAVRVDAAHLHARLKAAQPAGKSPVAIFLVVPSELSFKSEATLQVQKSGLAAGSSLVIHRVSHKLGTLAPAAEAAVDAAGTLATISGKGLEELGWLLLYKK